LITGGQKYHERQYLCLQAIFVSPLAIVL